MLREMDMQKITPPHSLYIGVVLCSSDVTVCGRENEQLADKEIYITAKAVKAALESQGHRVDLVDLGKTSIDSARSYDWIFNLAENVCGFPYQEYEITEMIEKLGIGFTGSGSLCFKTCLEKSHAKTELMRGGIITPAFEVFSAGDAIHTRLPFPLIVKPVHEGGSIGIHEDSVVHNTDDLTSRVKRIHEFFNQAAIVEEFIEGRDFTASILGNNDEAVVLPLSECIYPQNGRPKLLSYESIWIPESTPYQTIVAKCPCDLDPSLDQHIREIALRAFRILGCQDYASVDIKLSANIPYVLEVNTNPCINPDDTGFTRSAAAAGMSYKELVNSILQSSIKNKSLEFTAHIRR
jgi:D-alanine-D-alanine ligase